VQVVVVNHDKKGEPAMKYSTLYCVSALMLGIHASTASAQPTCGMIDAAISSTEDFAEVATGTDRAAIQQALAAIRKNFALVQSSVDATVRAQLQERLRTVTSATQSGQMSRASVAALDIYRLLIGAFEQRLPTSRPVAMLDYAGFRLIALTTAKPVDWQTIAATVRGARQNWNLTRKKIKDKGLSDLSENIIVGLEKAGTAQDSGWLSSVAQIQLDSVDLLERVVKNTGKGACR
jgi:hypothetical protein